jgi:hypothetical protein
VSDAKFRWFEDMYTDDLLPIGHRGILGYCAIRYAMESEGFVIKLRQETIAANLGIDLRTVQRAFAMGRQRGWVQKIGVGQRGRGHHEADSHTISWPGEMPGRNVPHSDKCPAEMSEMPGRANAATSENDVPKGLDTGFSNYQGFEPGFGDGGGGGLSALFGGMFNNGEPRADEQKALPAPPPVIDAEIVDDPDAPRCLTLDCNRAATREDFCAQHWAVENWRKS